SNELGVVGRSYFGRARHRRFESGSRISVLWPRFIGTWNGRSSSKDSITRTTNDCTTVSARVMPGPCVSTSTRDSIIRTNWLGSWKTTTSHVQPPRSVERSRRLLRSLHFYHLGCGSFTKANLKGEGNASHLIWFARPKRYETKGYNSSTTDCFPCCVCQSS